MFVSLPKLQQIMSELRTATDIPYEICCSGKNVQLGYMTVTGQFKILTAAGTADEIARVVLALLNIELCRQSAQTDRDYVPANREMTWLPSRMFEPKLVKKESLAI